MTEQKIQYKVYFFMQGRECSEANLMTASKALRTVDEAESFEYPYKICEYVDGKRRGIITKEQLEERI